MTWSNGDVSLSQTLTDNDHLYPGHINELRTAIDNISVSIKNYGAVGDGVTDDSHNGAGGAGGVGRIHIDYSKSYTGTSNPTIDARQDLTVKAMGGYNFIPFF